MSLMLCLCVSITDHVDKGRDENEDDAKDSDQGAVGARLDDLLRNRLHGSRKELQKRSRRRIMSREQFRRRFSRSHRARLP